MITLSLVEQKMLLHVRLSAVLGYGQSGEKRWVLIAGMGLVEVSDTYQYLHDTIEGGSV